MLHDQKDGLHKQAQDSHENRDVFRFFCDGRVNISHVPIPPDFGLDRQRQNNTRGAVLLLLLPFSVVFATNRSDFVSDLDAFFFVFRRFQPEKKRFFVHFQRLLRHAVGDRIEPEFFGEREPTCQKS